MKTPRLAFLDWLKCLGLALVVFGHVSAALDRLLPPIYPKQLGVAFFLFATGFSLAREKRPAGRVLYNRLFEVFLFGLAAALLMSAVDYARAGRLALSNYLPFLLGLNVAFNNFPANPTTWYVGTYLHVLLLWALVLRNLTVRPWVLALAAVAEVLCRAALAQSFGPFVAYMAFPNWMTVFLLGMYCGQRGEDRKTTGAARYLAGLGLLVAAWPLAWGAVDKESSFPFMRFLVGPRLVDLGVTSAAVTFVYVAWTWLAYQTTRRLGAPAWARFVARNTLIVFIAHMPLYYALQAPVNAWTQHTWARVAVRFTACFLLLVLASEVIRRIVRPESLREKLWLRCEQYFLRGPSPEHVTEPLGSVPVTNAANR